MRLAAKVTAIFSAFKTIEFLLSDRLNNHKDSTVVYMATLSYINADVFSLYMKLYCFRI